MELTEGQKEALVSAAVNTHGQCYVCAAGICEALVRAFPYVDWYSLVAEKGHWHVNMLRGFGGR